jgi:hypothetical protein
MVFKLSLGEFGMIWGNQFTNDQHSRSTDVGHLSPFFFLSLVCGVMQFRHISATQH